MESESEKPIAVKLSGAQSVDDFIRAGLEKHLNFKPQRSNGGVHSFFMNMMEKSLISVVMEKTNGNQSLAAQILGINRNTLRKKISGYDIKAEKEKGKSAIMDS